MKTTNSGGGDSSFQGIGSGTKNIGGGSDGFMGGGAEGFMGGGDSS